MDNYQYVKGWRAQNPEKVAEYAKRYAAKHPETRRKASIKYRESHLEEVREAEKLRQRERRKTPEFQAAQATRMRRFKARKRAEEERIAGRPKPDRCEICKGNDFRIVWDHCHTLGHFRGWICDRCNRVLGIVKDNQQILINMARYLKEHKYGTVDNEETKQSAEFGFCGTGSVVSG